MAAELTTNSGLGMLYMPSIVSPCLSVKAHCLVYHPVANVSIQQKILVAMSVTLGVHIFINGISYELDYIPIVSGVPI